MKSSSDMYGIDDIGVSEGLRVSSSLRRSVSMPVIRQITVWNR